MTVSKRDRASWRDVLKIHPAAELFPLMSPDELRTLGEDIRKNGLTNPIAFWEAGKNTPPLLLDGRNRLDAMEDVGLSVIDKGGKWLDGNFRILRGGDPYAFVISANIHRRHLTAEQKRELIAKLIKATREKSDRQIAETTKTDHKTVGSVRTKMEARGEIPHVAKRKDSKGRKQPAKKTAIVVEQRLQARELMQERARARERARRESEEFHADISRFAHKLIQLDIKLARELHHVLAMSGSDAMQLMDDLAAGIEIEEAGNSNKAELSGNAADPDGSAKAMKAKLAATDDGLDIPACLRRTSPEKQPSKE